MLKKRITCLWSIMAFMAIIGFSGLAFAADVIIDNGDPGTSFSGTWSPSSGSNPYGGSSLYSREGGATYTYEASVSGVQDVSLWWTKWGSRCVDVQVEIYDGNGLLDTVEVDQKHDGGQWNPLGTYTFTGTAYVIINSQGDCSTCADAVKFSTSSGAVKHLRSWSQKLPGDERFELVLDGAGVLDKETALVWEQSPDTTSRVWTNALSHCFTKKVGGRKGWRLPTVEELASLVDDTQTDPALPSGHLFDTDAVQLSWYWSSTTSAANTAHAWAVYFIRGGVGNGTKASDEYVWCVRGGQGHDAY